MIDSFFLSSQDWGAPWGPRRCEYLATYKAKPTGQNLLYVKVFPALPKDFGEKNSDVNKLLLGMINSKWSLRDVGRPDFMVDIYIPTAELTKAVVNVKDLIRVGIGKLHKTIQEAELN
jgi:hypothetical protein